MPGVLASGAHGDDGVPPPRHRWHPVSDVWASCSDPLGCGLVHDNEGIVRRRGWWRDTETGEWQRHSPDPGVECWPVDPVSLAAIPPDPYHYPHDNEEVF